MKFVIATHNVHKLDELRRILAPLGVEADIDENLPEAEETGVTFAENAFIKADEACRFTGLPAIADDSGLMVDALGGEPGVYSARYAPVGQRKATVLQKLAGLPLEQRGAGFVSAVCCVFPNGDIVTAEGVCRGHIGEETRGDGGFGYDPIFVTESGRTFSELTPEEKDAISHRGRALRAFVEKLAKYLEETSC